MRLFEVAPAHASIFGALVKAVAAAERAEPGVTTEYGWRSATVARFRLHGVGRSTVFRWLAHIQGPGWAASAVPRAAVPVQQVAPRQPGPTPAALLGLPLFQTPITIQPGPAPRTEDRMPEVPMLVPTTVEGETRIRDVDLAVRLGFGKARDIRPLIARHGAALSQMGLLPQIEEVVGKGQRSQAYFLNRKQAIFITAKSETPTATDITIEIIERFDAYERGATPAALPAPALNVRDPQQLRTIMVQLIEVNQELVQRTEAAEAEVVQLQPLAQAYQRLEASEGSMCITDTAKLLGVKRNVLIRWLRANGWIYKRSRAAHWIGYEAKLKTAVIELRPELYRTPDGEERIRPQVVITPKGLALLTKVMRPGGLAA